MRYFSLLSVFLWVSLVVAQPPPVRLITGDLPPVDVNEYPTYQALAETVVPIADRLDIAQRLGNGVLDEQNSFVQPLIGDVQPFFVLDVAQNATSTITAELVAMGEHAYVWIEQPVKVDREAVAEYVTRFDNEIYSQVRALWGSESNPGIDGDSRIYLLFTRFIAPSIAGYFTSQHMYPDEIVPNSNEHEMLIFNLNIFEQGWNIDLLLRFSAHEFQHMIRHNVDENESSWIDEGFSVFTEHYLNFDDDRYFASAFIANPRTQVNHWQGGIENYGASFLFMHYFYERFGIEGLQTLSQEPTDGFISINNALKTLGQVEADVFFADWVLANGINRPQSGYGYQKWWADVPTTARPLATVSAYPYLTESSANQYATDYYVLENVANAQRLTLDLTKNSTVNLLPFKVTGHHLYGNIGDESDTTATIDFDLRAVAQATLQYQVWYNLETYWDYAYVMVSNDNGDSWQIVPTTRTTRENLYGKSYGSGYTGDSQGWQSDQVDLTPFVGQIIQVRFEMITDDATTWEGIAIDDVILADINYQQDFEGVTNDWQLDGWIRSDNRLPQRAWVQVAQITGESVYLTRHLAEENGQYTLDLVPNAEKIVLAISPFAPVTTVNMPYTLKIDVLD